ncbi:hypothetical protein HYR54_15295 [Candidatus Acetothermia bacterium]|nr:hypothetical protein [Candidatus Acetothermia bacterium]
MERGQIYSPDQLIELLFSNLDRDKAAVNLRVRISELRRVLEPELKKGAHSQFILTTHQGYYFGNEAHCIVDVEEFARSCEKALYLEQHGRYPQAIHNYQAAMQLYQGDFLSEDQYEDWAILERERWREEFLIALSHLAECHACLEHYDQAIASCRQALCKDAYREAIYRQLMRYYSLTDNLNGALRAYEDCRERLAKSLAREPAAATQTLYKQIQNGENLNVALVLHSVLG